MLAPAAQFGQVHTAIGICTRKNKMSHLGHTSCIVASMGWNSGVSVEFATCDMMRLLATSWSS
eukprot:330276-Amphidinium_carterae.1